MSAVASARERDTLQRKSFVGELNEKTATWAGLRRWCGTSAVMTTRRARGRKLLPRYGEGGYRRRPPSRSWDLRGGLQVINLSRRKEVLREWMHQLASLPRLLASCCLSLAECSLCLEGQGRAWCSLWQAAMEGREQSRRVDGRYGRTHRKYRLHSPRIFSLWKLMSLSPKRNSGHFNVEQQLSPL